MLQHGTLLSDAPKMDSTKFRNQHFTSSHVALMESIMTQTASCSSATSKSISLLFFIKEVTNVEWQYKKFMGMQSEN
jgi:hypothetical protein